MDKDGKVAWVGNPFAMEPRLEKVVAGTFDPKQEAELVAKIDALNERVGEAARAKEYDKAIGTLEEMTKLDPSLAEDTAMMRVSLLLRKKDYPAANKYAAQLADGQFKDDPNSQGRIATLMLISDEPERADADLALRMAERAYAADPTDVNAQRAAALAYAAKKNYPKAAELQEKVVAQLKGPLRTREAKVLDGYKTKAAGGGK